MFLYSLCMLGKKVREGRRYRVNIGKLKVFKEKELMGMKIILLLYIYL